MGRLTAHSRARTRGFTLLELSIVIICAGVLVAAVVIPASASVGDARRIGAANEVHRRLVAARSAAMAGGEPAGLAIDPGAGTLTPIRLDGTSLAVSTRHDIFGQVEGPFRIGEAFEGVAITALVNGAGVSGAAAIWFGIDGTPEVRDAAGVRTGPFTHDAAVTLTGGRTVTVRRLSGLVEIEGGN